MEKKIIRLGMLAMVMAFGMAVAGCDDGSTNGNGNENGSGNGNGNNPPTQPTVFTLYTFAEGIFIPYSGSGSEQNVTGTFLVTSGSLDNVGTISADGKLTLNFPASVADNMLRDAYGDAVPGLRFGILKISPELEFVNGNGDSLSVEYYNKAFSSYGNSFMPGWNYVGENFTPVTNTNGYRWVIVNP